MDVTTLSVLNWVSFSTVPPTERSEVRDNNDSEVVASDLCDPECLLYSFVTSTLIIGMLCALGLVGNTVSFVVFAKDSVKTSTLFLFQSLCVIDNLLLVTVFPLYCFPPFVSYTGIHSSYLSHGHYFVVMYVFPLASVSQTATVWVTVLVGINRYIAVCKPYQSARLCTVRQAKMQLAVVLTFAVLYNVTRFAELYPEYVTTPNGTTYLQPAQTVLGKNRLYIVVYDNILYMIFMLILPLVLLTVLNVRLVNALKSLQRKRAEMQSASQRHDNNVTLVLIVVIVVFIVCQAPALANRFMWSLLDDGARDCGGPQFYFSRLSNTLVIANSAVNFIVYAVLNARFRQILTQCCGCGCGGGFRRSELKNPNYGHSYSVFRSSQKNSTNSQHVADQKTTENTTTAAAF